MSHHAPHTGTQHPQVHGVPLFGVHSTHRYTVCPHSGHKPHTQVVHGVPSFGVPAPHPWVNREAERPTEGAAAQEPGCAFLQGCPLTEETLLARPELAPSTRCPFASPLSPLALCSWARCRDVALKPPHLQRRDNNTCLPNRDFARIRQLMLLCVLKV